MARVVIAGAGAAGLFAVGRALARGHAVTLVEHMDAPGRKLAITGKGRCNLTCNCTPEEFLQGVRHNPRFLYSALHALPPAKLMAFFEGELRVPLKTERGQRVFPASDDAREVVAALLRYAGGAKMVKGRAAEIEELDGKVAALRLRDGRLLPADRLLVATGGLSHPSTGSTGLGYEMARAVGHTIVEPQPSLVSLVEAGALCRPLTGLSLRNVTLTLLENDKAVFSEQGELLFTHFGLSGPLTLSASSFMEPGQGRRYTAVIDLKPALDEQRLDARIQRDFAAMANRDAANCLDKLLPGKLRAAMLARWGIPPGTKVNQITKEQRRRLVQLVKGFSIPIKEKGDLEHAVITAGGVSVREVNPRTMESKKLPGLFFAGEVLDLDGYTGGYNLHIAWCTAEAAAAAF